jgi:hypothetical protein
MTYSVVGEGESSEKGGLGVVLDNFEALRKKPDEARSGPGTVGRDFP